MRKLRAKGGVISQRVRGKGGRLLRRTGLLPAGVADGLGDDLKLENYAFVGEVVVFFPNTPTDMADLRRWFRTLTTLDAHYGLTVVTQDSRVTAFVQRETQLAVVTVALYATLDAVLARSTVKMAVYVSDHAWNFSMLRFTSLAHVLFLERTDVQRMRNQVKAYDYCFVWNMDLFDLIRRVVKRYDPDRCLLIGETPIVSADRDRELLERCERVFAARDTEWKRVTENGAVGP